MARLAGRRLRLTKCPQWMTDMHRQLLRGKHVILHGNVMDVFAVERPDGERDKHQYISVTQFLDEYFPAEGCAIVVHYDLVDGLRVARPDMQRSLDDLTRSPHANSTTQSGAAWNSGRPAAQDRAAGPDQDPSGPARRSPLAGFAAQTTDLVPAFDQALTLMGRAVSQEKTPVAFIIDYADKLVSDPARHSAEEARSLVRLKKLVEAPRYITTEGDYFERHNAIVLVAPHLGGIPPWFYRDHATLALVQVGRPTREERLQYLKGKLPEFHGASELTAPSMERVREELVALTDGMTMRDVGSLRRASRAEQIAVSTPQHLVNYFRHGERTDPWEGIDEERIRNSEELLKARVFGQDRVIRSVMLTLAAARVGITANPVTTMVGKPKGTFFFVGPTGVGKTQLAKALAEVVFGDDTRMARFDMSEYSEKHGADRLVGAPPGFVGYEEGGQLTNRVLETPFGLLLFDEIEKADGRVMDKFLQILEDGRLTDGKGQTAYFSQSLIIFTSNLGSDSLPAHAATGQMSYEEVQEHFRAQVRSHFVHTLKRPELLNRLGDNILVFDVLRGDTMTQGVIRKFMQSLEKSAMERCGLRLRWDDAALLAGVKRRLHETRAGHSFGGRGINTLLETELSLPLNRWVLEQQGRVSGRTLLMRMSGAGSPFEEIEP